MPVNPYRSLEPYRQLQTTRTLPKIIVNEKREVVEVTCGAERYFTLTEKESILDVLRLVHEEFRPLLKTAIQQVFQEGTPSAVDAIPFRSGQETRYVSLIVSPIQVPRYAALHALIVFHETESLHGQPSKILELEQQVRQSRERLQDIRDAYEIDRDELWALYERNQSLAQELTATKEEFERLRTRLSRKLERRKGIDRDLENLIGSFDAGALFLDRELNIQHFTPHIQELFDLTHEDLGRPLAEIAHHLQYERLLEDSHRVAAEDIPVDREVCTDDGRWFLMRIRYYHTGKQRPDGVVLSFVEISKIKRAEATLEQSEARFHAIFENALDAVLLTDDDGRYVEVNPAACTLLGYDREELLHKHIRDISADPGDRYSTAWKLFQDTGWQSGEYALRHKNGQTIMVEFRSVANILPGLHLAILRDVTERKHAERALRESEMHLRAVISSAPVIFFVLDSDGRILLSEGRALLHLGIQPCQLVGQNAIELYGSELDIQDGLQKVLAGETFRSTVELGNRIFDGWYAPLEEPDGRITGMIGVAIDVTEHRQAEEALRRSEARSRAILQGIPDLIFRISRDGVYLDVEARGEGALLAPAEQLLGHNIAEFLPEDAAAKAMQAIEESWHSDSVQCIEYTLETIDGRKHDFEARITRDDAESVLFIVRDITEQRHLEREIVRISTREQQRIGRDLHDGLGAHLTGMTMLVQSLSNKVAAGQEVAVSEIDTVKDLLREGVQQVRALSRRLYPVRLEKQGLEASLRELAADTARMSDIECTFECTGHIPDLEIETEVQLYWIAQEAVTNALRYAHAADAIRLRLVGSTDRVILSIQDNGQGISERAKKEGGIGLHIMEYRARMISANLTIENEPDGGTLVSCVLPVPDASRPRKTNGIRRNFSSGWHDRETTK